MSSLAGVGYESVTFRRKHYQVYSESINGKVQVRNIGSARWEWEINFPNMTQSEFAPLWTFIKGKEGMKTAFTMSLPDPENPGAYENYEVRIADMEQEFEMGVDSIVRFSVTVLEVL